MYSLKITPFNKLLKYVNTILFPPPSHILFLTDWKGDRFLLLAIARNFLELRTSVSVTLSLSPL